MRRLDPYSVVTTIINKKRGDSNMKSSKACGGKDESEKKIKQTISVRNVEKQLIHDLEESGGTHTYTCTLTCDKYRLPLL